MNNGKKFVLSHSSLSTCEECPRCFWLQQHHGIRWPEAFASRLPSRFDILIKKYFDGFRSKGTLPPFLEGKIKGRLQNPFREKYYVNHNERFSFVGKLDECMVTPDGLFLPLDHKTTSSDPRGKEIHPAYQKQMDAYAWILEENGNPTAGFGVLIFYYPIDSAEIEKGFQFHIQIEKVKTDPKAAKERFLRGVEVVEGAMPESFPQCKFCNYRTVVQQTTRPAEDKPPLAPVKPRSQKAGQQNLF